MIGSLRPWAMNTRVHSRPASSGCQPSTVGTKPENARIPPGPAGGAEPERVAHHRAHREAAEHGPLRTEPRALPQLVVEAGELVVRGVEGVVVRVADSRHHVPVVAGPARDLQRRARGDDVQPALGVEHLGQPEQVGLVGAAAMVEDHQPLGLPGGRALAVDQLAHAVTRRGFTIGWSVCSRCERRCSCCFGRRSSSPRCSGSSSTANPGLCVAISNRTPRGSWK